MMTNTANGICITQVATVFVPVADQKRALVFYLDKLGFEKRADFSYAEGGRWIEVAPPGSAIAIALVPPSEGKPAGGDETHCAFTTDDIEAGLDGFPPRRKNYPEAALEAFQQALDDYRQGKGAPTVAKAEIREAALAARKMEPVLNWVSWPSPGPPLSGLPTGRQVEFW